MSNTSKTEKTLNFYECIQLLHLVKENGMLHSDPNNKNNIIVYRNAGKNQPEGWYSQNLMRVASELVDDKKGQAYLQKKLEEKGVVVQLATSPFLK